MVRCLCTTFLLSIIVLAMIQCSEKEKRDPKFQQYYVHGERLYLKHCSNCHQKNGQGLGRLYPPLDSSDYLTNNLNDVLCIIRYGRKGDLVVNGVRYNQSMPSNPALSDLEIAEIATYIYNTWQNNRGIISVNETTAVLNSCEVN